MKYSTLRLLAFVCSALHIFFPCRANGAVFLIGLDGADSAVVADMVKAGRMPRLASLIKEGVQGTVGTLSALPLSSPVIWTSIATGKGAQKHGITGFVKPGGREWFRNGDRKSPALWNMATARQKTVGVAGYLMTYPPEPVNGVMVSNNYFMAVGTQGVVFPAGLKLKTSRSYHLGEGGSLTLAARIAGFSPPEIYNFMPSLDTYDSPDFRRHYIFGKLQEYAQADEGFARLSEELLDRNRFDLFMVYLPGIDRVSHLAWGQYEAAKSGKDVFFGDLVPAYYAYTDELVGRVLARAGRDDTVIIVSDHGLKLREGAGPLSVVSGDHRPGGIIIAKGPGIKAGARMDEQLYDCDIAPTVLYLLGLPVARDMDGKLAEGLFSNGHLKSHPAEYTDSYPAAPAKAGRQDLPFTPQELERLRLSGYLQ